MSNARLSYKKEHVKSDNHISSNYVSMAQILFPRVFYSSLTDAKSLSSFYSILLYCARATPWPSQGRVGHAVLLRGDAFFFPFTPEEQ